MSEDDCESALSFCSLCISLPLVLLHDHQNEENEAFLWVLDFMNVATDNQSQEILMWFGDNGHYTKSNFKWSSQAEWSCSIPGQQNTMDIWSHTSRHA